ncbi:capsular polysaccharide synthesis protein [Vibrio harveyi]|uniref:capsular polysaccharide synthesis protein n=1 Tax=Vibrio harveyi group TaxID=717610 RepID=UPI0022DDC571|nr:capsular polysaccharide synthesis protein [Vibrio owensii]MDA0382490.1 glycosyltransferase [Vibrio owensii]
MSVLSEYLIRLLDWSVVFIRRLTKKNSNVRHVVFVNWNGKYGDAIASAPIIDFLTSHCGIRVSVITNEQLRAFYYSVIQVDSVHVIEKNFGWLDLVKIALHVKRCDAVVPLFGKLGVKDVLCVFLLNPRVIFSTDSTLKMSSKAFIDKSTHNDIYGIYQSVADMVIGGYKTLVGASFCVEEDSVAKTYDYLINPYGSREDKSLSIDKTKSLIRHLDASHRGSRFGVMHSPDSLQSASRLVDDLSMSNVELVKGITNFESVIPIIRNSGLLISVDTSLVHVSKVLNKGVVAIYPETKYFNIWQPTTSRNFEIVQSKGLVDFGDTKDMNQFENVDVDYAFNRIKNSERLVSKKVVFMYWHSPKEDMPIGHALNIRNLESRLSGSDWVVIVTTLDKRSPDYIENYISLPPYFHQLIEKTGDPSVQHGNHSDIIRLRLLERYGGVYLDTSTIFLKHDFDEVSLYKRFKESPCASLAGYTNVTFTRKDERGINYFDDAKDGIELGVLYAKKNSSILREFNREIDKYWLWKTCEKEYRDYPPFRKFGLGEVSFLNEYHVHYSIYHLILTRQPELQSEIVVQSMHRKDKETADSHGPYAISDLFCRGISSYEPASPERMLRCFLEGSMDTCDGISTSLDERIGICQEMEFLVIPGYLRKGLEKEFTCLEDYLNKKSLYHEFYSFLASEINQSNMKNSQV